MLLAGWSADLDAAINHAEIVQVHVSGFAGAGAKFSALRPASVRKILPSQQRVHAPVDGPVDVLPNDVALAGGASDRRDQESGLTDSPRDRMSSVRKIKDGELVQPKGAVVDGGVTTYVH